MKYTYLLWNFTWYRRVKMSASQQALSLQSEVVISHWVSSTCSCVYSIDKETQLVTTSSQAALAARYRAKTPSAISRQFFILLKAPPTPTFFHKQRHLTKNTGNAKRKILCRWYTWNELFCKRRLHLYISNLTFLSNFDLSMYQRRQTETTGLRKELLEAF